MEPSDQCLEGDEVCDEEIRWRYRCGLVMRGYLACGT